MIQQAMKYYIITYHLTLDDFDSAMFLCRHNKVHTSS